MGVEPTSAEQWARDLMEQCGWKDAQACSAGEVVFLASVLADYRRIRVGSHSSDVASKVTNAFRELRELVEKHERQIAPEVVALERWEFRGVWKDGVVSEPMDFAQVVGLSERNPEVWVERRTVTEGPWIPVKETDELAP